MSSICTPHLLDAVVEGCRRTRDSRSLSAGVQQYHRLLVDVQLFRHFSQGLIPTSVLNDPFLCLLTSDAACTNMADLVLLAFRPTDRATVLGVPYSSIPCHL